MKIAVIIVNYNGISDTRQCLKSLKTAKRAGFEVEVIVVDNGSTDSSVASIKKDFPFATVLVNSENLGFAEGNNIGIRYGLKRGAEFILLLNNDTFVDENIFTELVQSAQAFPGGGIFCPKIYFAPHFETHPERYKPGELGKVIWYAGGMVDWDNMLAFHKGVDEVDTGHFGQQTKTSYGTGCALFVRKEVFEKAGYFDRKYYLYYEDLDFSLRTRKAGFEIYYVPRAQLWHKNAGSSGGTGSDLQSYYITRNRLLLGLRWAPWKTKLALLREATNLVISGTPTQKQAVGDFLRKKYGKRQTIKLVSVKLPVWKWPNIPKMPSMPKMPNLFKYFPKRKSKKQN